MVVCQQILLNFGADHSLFKICFRNDSKSSLFRSGAETWVWTVPLRVKASVCKSFSV